MWGEKWPDVEAEVVAAVGVNRGGIGDQERNRVGGGIGDDVGIVAASAIVVVGLVVWKNREGRRQNLVGRRWGRIRGTPRRQGRIRALKSGGCYEIGRIDSDDRKREGEELGGAVMEGRGRIDDAAKEAMEAVGLVVMEAVRGTARLGRPSMV